MTWLILMFPSAILVSVISLIEKKVLTNEHAVEYSSTVAVLNLLFSLPLIFFIDYRHLQPSIIIFLFFVTMLTASAFTLVAKSTKHMEVSSVSPMMNLSTAVTALLSFFILGESLTHFQIIGIILLMVGSYILQTHHYNSVLDPLKIILNSKYLHYILLAVLLYGLTSIFDRFALGTRDTDPLAYLVLLNIFIAFHFMTVLSIRYDGVRGLARGLKTMGWWSVVISFLTVFERVLNVFAIGMAQIGLVIAVKRSSSFFTIILAGEIFKEKNILRKLVASLMMVAGVILIVSWN